MDLHKSYPWNINPIALVIWLNPVNPDTCRAVPEKYFLDEIYLLLAMQWKFAIKCVIV
ncbi:MAG: hypothetical protein PHX14_03665 [Syntrophomonadaceae bacterium]|nr:hypothetical protein [Syntrophomonadaceae bacterium]